MPRRYKRTLLVKGDFDTMPKERTRKAHADVRIERCSEVACRQKSIIEIVAWDGITLDTHLYLCRKHWEEKSKEEKVKLKVLGMYADLRSYL
jgi:hypothetical protein